MFFTVCGCIQELKTFRVGYYKCYQYLIVIMFIIDLNLILDIILMRAINVKNSERCESIQLLKFLVDTIVQHGRDRVDRLRTLVSYMQNSFKEQYYRYSLRREIVFFRIRNNISNAFVSYRYISRKYIPMCANGVYGIKHAINFYIS